MINYDSVRQNLNSIPREMLSWTENVLLAIPGQEILTYEQHGCTVLRYLLYFYNNERLHFSCLILFCDVCSSRCIAVSHTQSWV